LTPQNWTDHGAIMTRAAAGLGATTSIPWLAQGGPQIACLSDPASMAAGMNEAGRAAGAIRVGMVRAAICATAKPVAPKIIHAPAPYKQITRNSTLNGNVIHLDVTLRIAPR
jgi:hypothetical protein